MGNIVIHAVQNEEGQTPCNWAKLSRDLCLLYGLSGSWELDSSALALWPSIILTMIPKTAMRNSYCSDCLISWRDCHHMAWRILLETTEHHWGGSSLLCSLGTWWFEQWSNILTVVNTDVQRKTD